MPLKPGELLIDDSTPIDVTHNFQVDGQRVGRGLIPRNYARFPAGYYRAAPAFDLPLIPRSEWSERIKEMEATKSRLSDIRRAANNGQPIPSLDQNGVGYCWIHSVTMAVILLRARMNLPYVRLSAFMAGCLIKNYRDDGGWGALGLDFVQQNGLPDVKYWPEKSMARSNDTPEMRANAKLHLVTESWADLQAAEYDRNLTEDQAMTLLLNRIPVVGDFNWWSHSVCLLDPVEVEPGSFGKRGINSWTDSYGDLGEFVLQGQKAHLDGGVAPRDTLPSPT